jgi:hypothetical protein
MTIGGAVSQLDNLLKADDIPCYYKTSIKAVMDTIALEQEPFKPMIEIDLYSVIKQKYIERDILDKIRAKINKIYNREGNSFDCLNALDELKEFIDKYKAESEK